MYNINIISYLLSPYWFMWTFDILGCMWTFNISDLTAEQKKHCLVRLVSTSLLLSTKPISLLVDKPVYLSTNSTKT